MSRVLVSYFSTGGSTENMARFIAEGVRFSGQVAEVIKIEEFKTSSSISGWDGYIIGSPTYSQDIPDAMKRFLAMAEKANLVGKLCGAFGSYSHDVAYRHDQYAPTIILNLLENSCKMKPFELGALTIKADSFGTIEGLKTCQDYGKIFGEKLIKN